MIYANRLIKFVVTLCLLVSAMSVQAQPSTGTFDLKFEFPDAACDSSCGSVDGYKLFLVGGGEISDTEASGTVTVSSFALSFDTEYCFQVAAYNAVIAELSDITPQSCVTTPAQQPPGKTTLIVSFPIAGG